MKQPELKDHVRESTSEKANQVVDEKTLQHIRENGYDGPETITQRLKALDNEWDVNKTLVVNASTLILSGILLGTYVHKKWYILSGVVSSFLLQHGLQGWCPPLTLFRKMGIRSTQEINEERLALKVLRGDFQPPLPTKPEELLRTIRKI